MGRIVPVNMIKKMLQSIRKSVKREKEVVPHDHEDPNVWSEVWYDPQGSQYGYKCRFCNATMSWTEYIDVETKWYEKRIAGNGDLRPTEFDNSRSSQYNQS